MTENPKLLRGGGCSFAVSIDEPPLTKTTVQYKKILGWSGMWNEFLLWGSQQGKWNRIWNRKNCQQGIQKNSSSFITYYVLPGIAYVRFSCMQNSAMCSSKQSKDASMT